MAGGNLATAELYDPENGTWSPTGNFPLGLWGHTATLPNGAVLVTGGISSTFVANEEIYNPARGTWKSTGSLTTVRFLHTATRLHNGEVLIAAGARPGGAELASTELGRSRRAINMTLRGEPFWWCNVDHVRNTQGLLNLWGLLP